MVIFMRLEKTSDLPSRLAQAIQETVGSATRLAEEIGMSKQTISAYVTGVRSPKRPTINAMAHTLGVNPLWLMGYDAPKYQTESAKTSVPPGFSPLPHTVKKPIVGQVACGEPILAEQNIEDYADVPDNIRCDFCLICRGDSMVDAGIQDGDIVYIRIQPEVEDGEIAAVRIGSEATLKRVYYDGKSITLIPANAAYRPKTYTGIDLEDIQIEGKAVGFTHWF